MNVLYAIITEYFEFWNFISTIMKTRLSRSYYILLNEYLAEITKVFKQLEENE